MTGPDKIVIVRHAEKPASDAAVGVDENGIEDKHSLTVRGWQRAGALIAYFETPRSPGIARPSTIVAATRTIGNDAGDDAPGARSAQTVAPLRKRIGATYWDDVPVGSEDVLIERLHTARDVVLIAWEHKRIHHIAAALLAQQAPEWPADRFDLVWILDRKPAAYALTIVNQNLLPGDRP